MDSEGDKKAGRTQRDCPSCWCDDEVWDDQEGMVEGSSEEGRDNRQTSTACPNPWPYAQEVSEAVKSVQESWYARWKHTYR